MNFFQAIKDQIAAFNKINSPTVILNEVIDDSLVSEEDIKISMELFGFQLFNDIKSTYSQYLKTHFSQNFHFIKQNGINGFAIDCFTYDLNTNDWRNIQLHCLSKLKESKYILHRNQVNTKSQQKNLTTTYKYYLKPSIKLMTEIPSEQLFGNVSIELKLQNSKPFRFLLHANYYSDRNYKKEKNFKILLDFLAQS